jgi:putative DNA primase/helicase
MSSEVKKSTPAEVAGAQEVEKMKVAMVDNKDTDFSAISQENLAAVTEEALAKIRQGGEWAVMLDYLFSECGQRVGFYCGQSDKKVSQLREGHLWAVLDSAIRRAEPMEKVPFRGGDGEAEWFGYDGQFWTRYELCEMEAVLIKFFEIMQVASIYQLNSIKKISSRLVANLFGEKSRRYSPSMQYLAFSNGVLDLNTFKLMPHNMALFPRFRVPYNYDPSARCPKFEAVVRFALSDELAAVLQECAGNLFLDFRFEKILVCYGGGCNGKSTILDAISEALGGKENVTSFDLASITNGSGLAVAGLAGKLANIANDSGALKIGNEALLKVYASGEGMMSKTLYRQPIVTRNYCKSLVAVNELPATADFTTGYFRRFIILPFRRQVPKEAINTNLKTELQAERAGVLNWILAGYRRLLAQGGFSHSEEVEKSLAEYRTDTDSVACFLEENDYQPSDSERIALAEFYEKFTEWSLKNGYRTMTNRKFAKRLRGLKIEVAKVGGTMWAKVEKKDSELPAEAHDLLF